MDKIPFGLYDFFALLSAGVVIVATADYVHGLGLLGSKEINPALGIALIVLVYATGQVVAHLAAVLLEQLLVVKLLGRPSLYLLGCKPRSRTASLVFPGYHQPLPQEVQDRIRYQAKSRQCEAGDDGLFLHAYPIVTANERYQARLDIFLSQYGFARNMALALVAAAVWLALAHWFSSRHPSLLFVELAILGAVAMFYRYLKFFRQYSYELFIRYAELPPAQSTAVLA